MSVLTRNPGRLSAENFQRLQNGYLVLLLENPETRRFDTIFFVASPISVS